MSKPTRSDLHRYVTAVVESRPDVFTDGAPPIDETRERELLQTLEDWRRRADAARNAFIEANGESHSITHAIDTVEMTPREARAAAGLYAGYVALLTDRLQKEHRKLTAHGIPTVDLADCLSETYEMMLRSLVNYDPTRAALSTYLVTDTRWMMQRALTADTGTSVTTTLYDDEIERGSLSLDFEPEGDLATEDIGSTLRDIAQEIADLDPRTRALADQLFGGAAPHGPHH